MKSHHYIISFDPRDGPDNGLTVDRAQALGEKFCAEHFPGHQALVCTHPDGHNHSGNIHVHIVINSLRIEEVPFLPYMDRPADTKAGCKHRCTDAALRYFKSEVMEMCHREGLYQIDLLNGSKNRVTDREYWAQKKGQAALDKQNAPMIAGGITPRQTKFETNKEKLRQTIRAALSAATSFEDFSSLLLREGVTVKESRGRLSYLTPDRTKPISARKLGDDFDRAAVLAVLEQNAARAAEKAAAISSTPPSIQDQLRADRAARTAPNVQRLVDIEQKKAEGKGRGYERWATMHNLKQMAATLNVYQEYGFTSPEQLEAAVDTAYQEMRQTSGELKALETKLQGKKELQRQVLAYAKTKPVRDGLKAQKSPKAREAYRQAHESDFIIADAAARYFKAHGITRLPARKALQDEIEQLVSKKSGLYNTYHEQKQRFKELQTVKRNIDQILRREEPHRRKEQLSFLNLAASQETFANSITIPAQGDDFDPIRVEYTQMLQNQLARGNNGLIKTKYLTFSIEADSIRSAKPRLERIETDVLNNFKRLGVAAEVLDGKARLAQLHAIFHMDEQAPFQFE